jgi:hypothetical protein
MAQTPRRPPPTSVLPEHQPAKKKEQSDVADKTVNNAKVDENIDNGKAAEKGQAAFEIDPGIAAKNEVNGDKDGDVDGNPRPRIENKVFQDTADDDRGQYIPPDGIHLSPLPNLLFSSDYIRKTGRRTIEHTREKKKDNYVKYGNR